MHRRIHSLGLCACVHTTATHRRIVTQTTAASPPIVGPTLTCVRAGASIDLFEFVRIDDADATRSRARAHTHTPEHMFTIAASAAATGRNTAVAQGNRARCDVHLVVMSGAVWSTVAASVRRGAAFAVRLFQYLGKRVSWRCQYIFMLHKL